MSELTPNTDDWLKLYEAAIRVKELAPWEWLTETDVFGVQNPETDEIGFVSVMGMQGQHYSVAVYLGAVGLYDFWAYEDAGPDAPPEGLFEIHHLQASFEDRNTLTQRDRDIIKQLGLKFRGRQAWPMFRAYRPGFFPWYVEAHEARFLTCVLEQTIELAPRYREDTSQLTPPGEDNYVVRVSLEKEGDLVWEDRIVSVSPPQPSSISIPMDLEALEHLLHQPRGAFDLQVDFFAVPIQVGERGTRPRLAYMLLVVEAQSGMVLGSEFMHADPTRDEMLGSIPVTLVRQFARRGIMPARISVRSELLYQLLELLVEDLGFKLEYSDDLYSLESAKAFLLDRFL